MKKNFTNEDLKRVIETKPVGDFYPFNLGDYNDQAIDDYLAKIVGELAMIENIKFEADFDSYGSGFASYVDVFCWKGDGSSTKEHDKVQSIDGLRLYLCRLTPVAVIGASQVTKHETGGVEEFLNSEKVDNIPPGDWKEQIEGIKNVLKRYRYKVLERTYVSELLPFDAKIPTIVADPPYKLFDAFFYWED